MNPDSEGFLRPIIDSQSCVNCGQCASVCPVLHPADLPDSLTGCYAAYNTDETEREKASSGGIFLLLAHWVLHHGGVVFGAAFNEDFSVSHRYAETEEAVYAFCGSKYVQSRIGNSYREVRQFLREGRYVLFTGTPCQVLGLYHYLGVSHEKLLTADIICHGVPSPDVWERYVKERAAKDNGGILPKNVRFRAKETGWSSYSMQFQYTDTCYSRCNAEDTYMHGFLKNLYLRPSCHNCIAKGIGRVSDFTLADFWGVQQIRPDMYDNRGTSLVFLHTEKAENLWTQMTEKMKTASVSADIAVKYNSAAMVPVESHPMRDVFFSQFRDKSLETLVWELVPKPEEIKLSLYFRIRRKLGRIVRKFIPKSKK